MGLGMMLVICGLHGGIFQFTAFKYVKILVCFSLILFLIFTI